MLYLLDLLSDPFSVHNGFASNVFKFVLEHVIRKVRLDQEGLELNGLHQVLAYADDVSMSGMVWVP